MERITHLKHSNTQLALQNKANGLGFRNFKKFQVFILLAICLGSRQMKTWEYEYINHLWKLSDNILFQKKKSLILLDELHQANMHFVIRFVSVEGTSYTVYFVLDITYEH